MPCKYSYFQKEYGGVISYYCKKDPTFCIVSKEPPKYCAKEYQQD